MSNSKELVLTDKQKDFLAHLQSKECSGDIRKAMKAAGYSDNTRPQEVIKGLKDQIIEVANNLMAANAVKATMGLVDGIDNPARPGASNKIAASKELLDRVGIAKKGEGTGTNIKIDTIVVLPAKEPIKTIEGVSKPLFDSLPIIDQISESLLTEPQT